MTPAPRTLVHRHRVFRSHPPEQTTCPRHNRVLDCLAVSGTVQQPSVDAPAARCIRLHARRGKRARAKTGATAGAEPAAPAPAPSVARSLAMTSAILASPPANPSATGCGPARGTVPCPPASVVVRRGGSLRLDPEFVRCAEGRTLEAFRRFADVRAVEIILGGSVTGEITCRLHITFTGSSPVIVGHSGAAILHAIDTAVETAAHIVALQTSRRGQ